MIRQLITIAVPLLAPVVLYLLYSWHVHRKGGEGGNGYSVVCLLILGDFLLQLFLAKTPSENLLEIVVMFPPPPK